MNPQDQALISKMAEQQLGPDPSAPPPADPAAMQAAAAQQESPPTNNEKVQAAGAPETEGDRMHGEAVTYLDVDFGDGDSRRLSSDQVRDTMKRYRDLNYRHQTEVAPNKPVLDLVSQLIEGARAEGHEATGDEVAEFLQAAIQAYTSNPTMGQQSAPPAPRGEPVMGRPSADYPHDVEAQLAQWEQENAIQLPPMLRNSVTQMQQLSQQNQQMQQMMQQLLQQANGVNEGAQQNLQEAHQAESRAMRQLAANNLNQAQQKYQLPDADEQDFFTYAYERGFTVEDFVDPQLTERVMGDFRNAKQSPEMERLREMAKRRTAYTGSLGNQPGAGGQQKAPDQNQQFIDEMTQNIMQKRNML
jgi:hypothetical protein